MACVSSVTVAICCLLAMSVATASDLEQRLAGADLKRGQLLYLQCRACHDVEAGLPHKVGPGLHGILGRKAGSLRDFKYTDALAKSGIVWTPETLDAWLRQPGAMVPGNGMAFAGIASEADRASLIAWLLASSSAR